jgi:hypothetical protein
VIFVFIAYSADVKIADVEVIIYHAFVNINNAIVNAYIGIVSVYIAIVSVYIGIVKTNIITVSYLFKKNSVLLKVFHFCFDKYIFRYFRLGNLITNALIL